MSYYIPKVKVFKTTGSQIAIGSDLGIVCTNQMDKKARTHTPGGAPLSDSNLLVSILKVSDATGARSATQQLTSGIARIGR